jgi:outer membrane receptor protein involved in Fe transport
MGMIDHNGAHGLPARLSAVCLPFLLVLSFSVPTFAGETAGQTPLETLLGMSLEELIEVEIGIATKSLMPVRKAPATATVISAEDIRIMGARNLLEVLERIPGIGVTRNHYSVYAIEIRGLKAIRQSKIKFMLDGHTLTMPTVGESFWKFEDIALEQVERVEVIRGPGSALYGANAFIGIINVVTRKGKNIDGTQVSAGGGSFGTGRVNLLHGKQYGQVDLMASISYTTTEGAQLGVESDAIGRSGFTDDWARTWDGTFKAAWKGLVLESGYTSRKNGPYIGVANAVNDDSELMSDQFFADLSCSRPLNDTLNMNARAYYDYADVTFEWQAFPPGTAFSALPAHFFPDGVYGTPHFKDRIYGVELGGDYTLTGANTLTFGAVYEYSEQYDITHHTNFDPNTLFNLGSYQDISAWGNWNIPASRTNIAAYIQDAWQIKDNLTLTAGLRYDHYDDVGNSTNPRLGLVWGMFKDVDLKLLYGEAFRIPTFDELYSINNPASVGNPNLQPEEMRTCEVSLGYGPAKGPKIAATGFYNKYSDKIDLVPTGVPGMLAFQNTDDISIYGVELEARQRFQDIELYGNYSWDHPEDDTTGETLPEVPDFRWNLGLNYWIADWGKGNFHIQHVSDRGRAAGDMRKDLDAYTVVDANFIVMNVFKSTELRASLFNIFDEKYAYPAPPTTLFNDYPAPGRSIFLEARLTF